MKAQFKGAGIVPNLLTTGTLFCGFYAILLVLREDYHGALLFIVIASIFDLFDGYIARILGVQSEFGAHYDSLSDAVAFGVAPALLVFYWLQKTSHIFPDSIAAQLGNIPPLLYLLCVIIRLARFNVTSSHDKLFFTGAPSPGAALAVCALVSLALDPVVSLRGDMLWYHSLLVAGVVAVGLLMISRLPYPSFKGVQLSKKIKPFFMVAVLVFIALSVQEIRWPLFAALFYTLAIALWYLMRNLSKWVSTDRPPPTANQNPD